MFDINFFQKAVELRRRIIARECVEFSHDALFEQFEQYRSPFPHLFNIETTNVCNMQCIMCPRPKLMNRKIEHMDPQLFHDVIQQVTPHSENEIRQFSSFVKKTYAIDASDKNENAFYFYTVAHHITLHGYGEPVLDPYIVERVKACSERRLPTYFSCVPINIKLKQMEALMDAGLGVIKFAIDSLDDREQKRIRGNHNDFTQSYQNILDVIRLKEKNNYQTRIVITLIELSGDTRFAETARAFTQLWKDHPVYPYIKSQDNRWYFKEEAEARNRSHYETAYCEFPWTSLTVMADGSVVPCTQDYNTEMILGNIRDNNLKDIWNGEKYKDFRFKHISGKCASALKCYDRCDIKMLCQRRSQI